MPRYLTLLPILLPTLYLWECDARALQRGTWVIEQGTKIGLSFRGLELECVFLWPLPPEWTRTDPLFVQRGRLLPSHQRDDRVRSRNLVRLSLLSHSHGSSLTPCLHSDYCLAVYDIRSFDTKTSSSFPPLADFPSILFNTPDAKQRERIDDLRAATEILSIHSKSFSTASMVFDGRLRLDLLALFVLQLSLLFLIH